jgi:hypothetical protein
MPKFRDITGQRFGRLVAIKVVSKTRRAAPRIDTKWLCQCDCGQQHITGLTSLRTGSTSSCGCLAAEGNNATHGAARNGKLTPEYMSWKGMRARCQYKKHKDYKSYGGRGITVCERWSKFENFLADMGERPPGYSIERIDVNGHYEPANCTWIPMSDQPKTRRRR